MKPLYSRPIRQFLLVLLLLALAPALAIISLSAWDHHHKTISQTERNLEHLVETIALHQESMVLSTRQFLLTLAEIPPIKHRDPALSQHLLHELHKQNPHYVNILAADPDGFIYANAVRAPGFSVKDRKYFKDVLSSRQFAAGEYVISRSTKKPVLNYAAPVFDAAGELSAVVIVGLDLSYYDRLLSQTQLPNGTTVTLTDYKGVILHHSPQPDGTPGTPDASFKLMTNGQDAGFFRNKNELGVQLNAWKRLKLSDNAAPHLYIRLTVPESEAAAGVGLIALRDISLLLVVALLVLLAAWVVGNRGIVRPVQSLVEATTKIGNGQLETRVPATPAPRELEQLVAGFNTMAATLAERQHQQADMVRELQQSEEKYRIVADYTLDWEYWLGPEGEILYMSPASYELTGYHRDEFFADPTLLDKIFHPADREWMSSHITEPYDEILSHARDVRIITRQGQERWIAHACCAVNDSDGRPMGRRGCNRDVTDRKQAELALQQKSQELADLNRTLQERVLEELHKNREKDRILMIQARQAAMGEMISNIAHQWRQPLNNLALMVQGLLVDYDYNELNREQLQSSVQHGMDLILYMSSTIDDFRNFFKPNKQKSHFSLQAVTQQAINFVSASLMASQITIQLQVVQDATSFGYPNECTQVLINLLGNARDALLEHLPDIPAIIVTIDRGPAGPSISVADNGGGIPETILDRIFDPYFTTKEQGKGTGIGLYMAKTIIEKNMGGSLTVHNQPHGAIFTITLPTDENAAAAVLPTTSAAPA